MARAYKSAADRIVLYDNEPLNERQFGLILLDRPQRIDFDAEHADIASIIGEEEVEKAERAALRTQVIDNPLQPVNIGTKILQFFAVNPNQDVLMRDRKAAVLFENVDGTEVPLFRLDRDEVWGLAHGEGFATTLYLESLEPVAEQPA